MSQPSLTEIEQELTETRRRLALDLARLTSPSTLSGFKQDAVAEIWQSKDELLAKTGSATKTAAHNLLDNLKGRAIANPAAALAIGGGIAWRLLRKPPVSAVLVGIGVISLIKTDPGPNAAEDLRARAGELADAAAERVAKLGSRARDLGSESVVRLEAAAAPISNRAAEVSQFTHDALGDIADRAGQFAQRSASQIAENRDNYLLGGAALAIAAALGLSYARRVDP